MQEIAPCIDAADWQARVIYVDGDLCVFNKPGWLVCHPSKCGPWSSLAGASRLSLGQDTIHLISRLDRETSGVVVMARNPVMAARLQKAQMQRRVRKSYVAILKGEMKGPVEVDAALGPDPDSPVAIIQKVGQGPDFQAAQTRFEPLCQAGGYTLCRVIPHTGRKHQIRAHALHIGFPLVGDKLYGGDPMLYLDFVLHGWTDQHEQSLGLRRQALHAHTIFFDSADVPVGPFRAPLPTDLRVFVLENMGAAAMRVLSALC